MGPRRRKPSLSNPLDKPRAFELLFRPKTFTSVWNWLQRLGVPLRDRRDVAQDVFLAAHQSFHTYDPLRARPERWLNKIAVHVSAHYRDRARHRREELALDEDLELVVDEHPPTDDVIGGEQERMLVLELLQQLEPDLRAILIAHDIDGIPMTEIAQERGIPLSTAYKWRSRALAAFSEIVTERRRQERERTGLAVLPWVGLEKLLEAARGPSEVARLDVLQRVQGAIEDAQRRDSVPAPPLGPTGVGLGMPPWAAAPLLASVLAALVWFGPTQPPRLEPVVGERAQALTYITTAAPSGAPARTAAAAAPPASSAGAPRAKAQHPADAPAPAARPPAGDDPYEEATPRPAARPAPVLSHGSERDQGLFDRCLLALKQGDAVAALAVLDAYEKEVPHTVLEMERQVLRVRALFRAGRVAEARALAPRILERFPQSKSLLEWLDLGAARPRAAAPEVRRPR